MSSHFTKAAFLFGNQGTLVCPGLSFVCSQMETVFLDDVINLSGILGVLDPLSNLSSLTYSRDSI